MLLEESARLLEPNHKPEFLINARENDGPPAPVGSIVPEGSLLQHWLLRQIFSTLLCLANHADIYHCARDAIRPPPFLRSVKSPNSRSLWISERQPLTVDRKSTRLNSSHANISYAVFCLK